MMISEKKGVKDLIEMGYDIIKDIIEFIFKEEYLMIEEKAVNKRYTR